MMNLRSCKLTALLCVLAGVLVVAQAQDVKQAVAGATNFQRLDANFASGGVTTPEAFAAIKQLGFRTVINLRTASEPGADLDGEARIVGEAGLRYFSLPFSPSAPDLTSVDKFLDVVKETGNRPVYIHCQAGQRAIAFWMIKRVVVDGWTTEKMLAEADTLKMTNQRLRDFVTAYLKDHQK
jgi:uncharacterized protein (TIGR01244 family)